MLETEMPDVVGLQEPRAAQRVYLKENLKNYTYEEVPGTGDSKGGNTGLIWRNDRFEKLDGGYFFLSRTPDVPSRSFDVPDEVWRASVWVHLRDKKSGKDFYFMSTHMPVRTKISMPNEEYINSRVLSAKLNVERMKKLAGNKSTCFIVGDMNCAEQYEDGSENPDGVRALAPYYKWMKSARALDKHPEINSFTAFGKGVQGPNRKIDFIFYRNAEPLSFETLTGSYGVKYVSDHWPIVHSIIHI